MISPVAFPWAAAIMWYVVGIVRGERTQTERRQQLRFDQIDYALEAFGRIGRELGVI